MLQQRACQQKRSRNRSCATTYTEQQPHATNCPPTSESTTGCRNAKWSNCPHRCARGWIGEGGTMQIMKCKTVMNGTFDSDDKAIASAKRNHPTYHHLASTARTTDSARHEVPCLPQALALPQQNSGNRDHPLNLSNANSMEGTSGAP